MLPPYALASASDTSASDLPDPADTSCAIVNASVAFCTSCVPSSNALNAGRNSLSAVPVALDIAEIMSSVAAIVASVAPTVFSIALANKACCCSSSAAAFAAKPSAPATAVNAAAAGIAAFLIANCAFSPTVSSCLNSLIALSMPLPSNSLIIGIDKAMITTPAARYA